MASRRSDNNIRFFTQTDRFYQRNGQWFLKTREGLDYGPYESKVEARYELIEFLDVVADEPVFRTGEGFNFV